MNLLKIVYLALWILSLILISSSSAQLIDVSQTPSQEAYQLGIDQAGPETQYSEYYSAVNGAPPGNHISIPTQFDINGHMPMNVLFSNQQQPVPFEQYLSTPSYASRNSLWIQGQTNWTQYAVVPQGAVVTLIAAAPIGGNGYLNFVNSDGQSYRYNFFFYPYSQLTFYADMPGRHTLSFDIAGTSSNPVTIDVTGNYEPQSRLPLASYYPGTQSFDYFPSMSGFSGGAESSLP